ncbi:unnamed protein product, partial [Candidula unifasciata]
TTHTIRKSTLGPGVSCRATDLVEVSQKDPADPKQRLVQIRKYEQQEIKTSILPGHIIQVCGPPLSGKSTLVQQATECIGERDNFHRIDFKCETAASLNEVLDLIAISLNTQPAPISSVNEEQILYVLTSTLLKFPNVHHILVFHKCHKLRNKAPEADSLGTTFLGFLRRVIDHLSNKLLLTILLTSRKRFQLKGHNTHTVEIGMLNYWDITRILQDYAKNTSLSPYASICLNMLPLPGAVKLFGDKYLADGVRRLAPSLLEEKIANDDQFWSELFKDQLDSVKTWLPGNVLPSIVHFCQFFGSSFHKDHLEYTVARNNKQKLQKLIRYLRQKYIVWSLPGTDRLVVHPLLVYYVHKSSSQKKLVLRGQCYDKSCNRYTDFLCRLLNRVETKMAEKHGKKGLVYGCLALEWPNIRHMIDMAIKCNQNTYKLFLKAAISARGIIFRCFNEEAHDMYEALFECAKKYGTVSEQGMVEALLGHSKAATVVLSKGGTWQQAEACLDSAIEKLRQYGPSFGLMWAIHRKAIIRTRQGKYSESQRMFKDAKSVIVVEADDSELREAFGVSRLQITEEKITGDIYTANAMIFLGENGMAKEKLEDCCEFMQSEFADHPELSTAVNSLGLIEERGNHDLAKALEKYLESYKIRQDYANFNREILVVSLNNIGMILLRQGQLALCKQFLREALNIRRDLGWKHSNTSLSLTHMGVVDFRSGDFAAAYRNTQEADAILQEINSNHDTRLRISNTLGHLSQLLEMERQRGKKEAGIQVETSPQGYFNRSVEMAKRTTGNHSDDGYHHLFLACEHAMLLALGNSEEDYKRHKDIMLPFFEVHETMGKMMFNANERIPKHNDLHKYFSSTDYKAINKRIFVTHLVKACEFCQMAAPFYSAEEMWCTDKPPNIDDSEEDEVTASAVQAHEDELACSSTNNTSEQNDRMPDNLDNADSAISDISNRACTPQDERWMPSAADLSLAYLKSKSREDLEKYKSAYLSTVSDICKQEFGLYTPSDINRQEPQLSTPAGNLNLQYNEQVTPSEILTNNSVVQSRRQDLIPADLQGATPDGSQVNKNSNTENTPAVYEKTLADFTSNNKPSSLVTDSSLNNLHDNARLSMMFATSAYSNANTLKLVNSNDIIEYDDDYSNFTDDDYDGEDHDDGDDVASETYDVNASYQHVHAISSGNEKGHIDSGPSYGFPPKKDQTRSQQSDKLLALQNPEMSLEIKDALNQNFGFGSPVVSLFQHSPANREFHIQVDNKQFQATDQARLQGNNVPNILRNQ